MSRREITTTVLNLTKGDTREEMRVLTVEGEFPTRLTGR